MNLLKHLYKQGTKPLVFAQCIYLFIVFLFFIVILFLNSGKFVFTLDDAYIHLALAENIAHGHYGINLTEFSAPSSSILWPLIIVPFTLLKEGVYFIFVLNILSSMLTLYVFWKIMQIKLGVKANERGNDVPLFLFLMIIPALNLVGLTFTGMEHSLQVALAVIIVYGLTYEIENKRFPIWCVISIIIAPLIRYECLAISIPALIYFYFNKYHKKAILAFCILILTMGGFSLFLWEHGLGVMPSSIVVKSPVIANYGKLGSVINNLQTNLLSSRGALLVLGLAILLILTIDRRKDIKQRHYSSSIAGAVLLHLLAGRYGWYGRYEIYIWATLMLSLLYLLGGRIFNYLKSFTNHKIIAALSIINVLLLAPYYYTLLTTPLASNNIYEQHYQMHRFVTDYYKRPIAVNDLGYVAYQNSNYVLDLGGLASLDAWKMNNGQNSVEWLENITAKNDVNFAMIYDDWFQGVPSSWIKMGELNLGKARITPSRSAVSFYAIGYAMAHEIEDLINKFRKTLPSDVVFRQ